MTFNHEQFSEALEGPLFFKDGEKLLGPVIAKPKT